jgi:hypothetical protein
MPSITFEYHSEAERVAIERAMAFVAEIHSLAQTVPDGQVLHACEGLALDKGRDLLLLALRAAVQRRIDVAEEKGAAPASAPVVPRACV